MNAIARPSTQRLAITPRERWNLNYPMTLTQIGELFAEHSRSTLVRLLDGCEPEVEGAGSRGALYLPSSFAPYVTHGQDWQPLPPASDDIAAANLDRDTEARR